jgi:antitoxin FitA
LISLPSNQAEVRHILESAVRPKVGLGSALAAIGRSLGGLELDLQRDPSPVRPAQFE